MGNNIVLLGGSNSVKANGLQMGIRRGIEKYNTKHVQPLRLCNFALGATTHIQNFYELKRKRNQEALRNARLIITESNINDVVANGSGYGNKEKLEYALIYRNLSWYYGELYALKKNVLCILLPTLHHWNDKTINAMHKKLALQFGFNCIDLQEYVDKHQLNDFIKSVDRFHVLGRIMRQLGENIISNLESFSPLKPHVLYQNPRFVICKAQALEVVSGGILEEREIKNSMYCENTSQLKEGETVLKFPRKFKGLMLLGVHSWNHSNGVVALTFTAKSVHYSSLEIFNKKQRVIKELSAHNLVVEFHKPYRIDEETCIRINHKMQEGREFYHNAVSWSKDAVKLPFCDLVGFFLVDFRGVAHEESIDFEALGCEKFSFKSAYYHNAIIPPIEVFKEIIEEYCLIMDPRKVKPFEEQIDGLNANVSALINEKDICLKEKKALQDILDSLPIKKQNLEIQNLQEELRIKQLQVKKLQQELKEKTPTQSVQIPLQRVIIDNNTATFRIHNHLSYKLGQAMISHSNTLFGMLRMPFVLWAISIAHKEQKRSNTGLKLPSLETYPDYKEAMREKECLAYKLGEALIQANRSSFVRGGGVY